ncbi:MAG: sigma-70 family RNA polymerase sigma factor [Sedimentisphaerales bacterium]|nr:sigma-70 family RNA polymerase sigma factor [Sedimentisphaerales bacterium]
MVEENSWCKLVELAQRGRDDCMSQLAREAKGRLCAYVYRVTLDHDLTDDLSQEILLQMMQSLGHLNQADRFWPWMYRIAQSKIKEHYKSKQRKKMISASAFYKDFLSHKNEHFQEDGLKQMLHDELSKKVMVAMKQIKQQYRAILSLRCYEQLSYADIAEAMQCNEVTARVLFFRAKKAIKKQLASQGLGKGLLLTSLALFGKLTTPAEATSTVTVSAASTKVGLTTAALATAGSKLGIATIATAITLASIAIAVMPESPKPNASFSASSLPNRNEIQSIHFTSQLKDNDPNTVGSLSKGAYEQWLYFPDGIDGPMFMRMQRWTPEQDQKLCSWLENAQGNYYYASDKNQVYIHNCRVCWSNLKVRRLPCDTADFTEFLSQVEGDLPSFAEYNHDPETGLLISSVDYRFTNAFNFSTEYLYNTTGPEQFQYNWPASITVIDERDQMHKRGWTLFRINGELNGKNISGLGQIPFVYSAAGEHPAWIRLNIADEIEIIDCSAGSQLRRADGITIAAYQAGTFFKGLPRPWMGMHTADIIRRDAVEKHLSFNSKLLENEDNLIISLDCRADMNLIYTINMEKDIVEDIRFIINGINSGTMYFSYLQDISPADAEFAEPVISDISQIPTQDGTGILWLANLASGNLDNR